MKTLETSTTTRTLSKDFAKISQTSMISSFRSVTRGIRVSFEKKRAPTYDTDTGVSSRDRPSLTFFDVSSRRISRDGGAYFGFVAG